MAKSKLSDSRTPPPGNTIIPLEFIFRDQRRRWRAGERALLETYLDNNPHWHFSQKELLDLIYHEILIREGLGEVPAIDEYAKRFPQLAHELRLHFEIHNALSSIMEPEEGSDQNDEDKEISRATFLNQLGQTPTSDRQASRVETDDGDRYVTSDEIARGGMGAVLRARDSKIQREVAIKYLLDQSDANKKARFIAEAQITGQLQHPNIVPVHDLGIDPHGRLFFAMKMVKGRSLAEVLEALRLDPTAGGKEWSLNRLLNSFIGVCNALAYAHARGVIHRDVKPANIMLGEFGAVYLMDWGLAKIIAEERNASGSSSPLGSGGALKVPVITDRERDADLTREGSVMGTLVYMSPEQASGHVGSMDGRTDVYSLGAILYEMLALKPHMDKTDDEVLMLKQAIEGKIVLPEERNRERVGAIPRELSAIAMKALARDPNDRYQTVTALQRDVERYQEGRSVSAKEDTVREMLWKVIKRNTAASAVAFASAIVLAVVVIVGGIVINRARIQAVNANREYWEEQRARQTLAINTVPAYLRAAKLAASNRAFEDALIQVDTALQYKPDYDQAHYFKAHLLSALLRFSEAAKEYELCTFQPPDDRLRELSRLCREVDADRPSTILAVANMMRMMGAYPMDDHLYRHVEQFAQSQQELLELYRNRIEAAWPGPGKSLTQDKQGQLILDLQDRKDVHDLAVIQGMKLSTLILRNCNQVDDLIPLTGMKLTSLNIAGCVRVGILSPLKEMELKSLDLSSCSAVRDFSVLKPMPLHTLALRSCTQLQDLSFLQGIPLVSLDLSNSVHVRDLSPLRGMPLKTLSVQGCEQVEDFSPLEGMPLKQIVLPSRELTGNQADVLRRCMSLDTIRIDYTESGTIPVMEFWERYDRGEFRKKK